MFLWWCKQKRAVALTSLMPMHFASVSLQQICLEGCPSSITLNKRRFAWRWRGSFALWCFIVTWPGTHFWCIQDIQDSFGTGIPCNSIISMMFKSFANCVSIVSLKYLQGLDAQAIQTVLCCGASYHAAQEETADFGQQPKGWPPTNDYGSCTASAPEVERLVGEGLWAQAWFWGGASLPPWQGGQPLTDLPEVLD